MGKSHLFRILGIGFALLLLAVYFMLNPAENTTTLDKKKQAMDNTREIDFSIEPVYVDLDTLQTIHLEYK